jgi:hypothetical protein
MTAPLKYYTLDELCVLAAAEDASRHARRQWGPWRLDTGTLELVYMGERGGRYPIDLERCGTSAEMLDWIFQLHGKSWTSATDIGDLVDAFHDVFNPQGTLCSCGNSKAIDASAYLRRRYPAKGSRR